MDNDKPHILVGVDGSEESIGALREAARLADLLHGSVEAIIAWEPLPAFDGYYYPTDVPAPRDVAQQVVDAAVRTAFPGLPPAGLTTSTVEGSAARVLVEESRRGDLLVVGARGRGGFAGLLLGSVSRACAAHAHCPVLIMRDRTASTRVPV